ncbi:hypothetical protein [Brachyspira hampsonii]|uniref:hypothetical protein n=1 Tax=Brachyspira hampsonii TaxID=1287055 RepID=UPI000D3CA43B|nr:hypothetical protein [Brachyspira hampsonii]PTY40588.1 hypothetical protein DQ06_08450 [Brachyspira hampsonii bv. II]
MKDKSFIYILIIILSIFVGLLTRIQLYDKYNVASGDTLEHYYNMRKYYDNKEFPVMGAYLVSPGLLIGSENVYEENVPRIPGSLFYLQYLVLYFLSGENIDIARLLNYILITISPLVFLIFILKKFGLKIMSIITSILFVNATFLHFQNEIYNPDTVFILSFISITLILIYISSDNKASYIASIFIFPILALEAMCHIAVFFSIVPAFIIYLIIRIKRTKQYIVPLSIGILISFLLYVPYIVYEISNGFPNLMNVINMKNSVKSIIQPPQIWSVLFFPTDEPNYNYGNKISVIFTRWFNGDIKLVFSFIFYIISVLIGLLSFIFFISDFFRKKLNNDDDLVFKESALLYFIYIIATIVLFMLLNLGSARPRYFYNIFPLTFIPIIYFIKKIEYKKIFNFILIFAVMNLFAVNIQIYEVYKNREKFGWGFMQPHIENIIKDSNTNSFNLYDSDQYSYVLMKIENPNFKLDTNSNIKYSIIKSGDTNFNNNMLIIYSNEQYITYKEEMTN